MGRQDSDLRNYTKWSNKLSMLCGLTAKSNSIYVTNPFSVQFTNYIAVIL